MEQTIETRPTEASPPSRLPSTDVAAVIAQTQQMAFQANRTSRQMDQILFQIKLSCEDFHFADAAIYAVSFNGQMQEGPSIRLGEELARIFGNMDYGFRVIRTGEDPYYGQFTDCEAYCWDVLSNNRSTSSFRVWHHIAKKDKLTGKYQYIAISEPSSVDRLIAARASKHIRNCILRILPSFMVRRAVDACNATWSKGSANGKPLHERVLDMVNAFAAIGVTKEMLEGKAGIPVDRWEAAQFKLFSQIFVGIKEGESVKDYFESFAVLESPKTSEVRQTLKDMKK